MTLLKNSFIHKLIVSLVAAMISLSAIAIDLSQTQNLANQGNVKAQLDLGITYLLGIGADQDYVKALEWYEKAANQGYAQAQFNLGVIYYHGEGVRQNIATAKELFGKACDNGDQKGCDNYRILSQR